MLAMLRELGATTIDADELVHRALDPDGQGYAPVAAEWGEAVLSPTGEIDRSLLGQVVFSDPEQLARLEAIIHPIVEREVDALMSEARGVLVLDAIKLFESGLARRCDEVWVVACSEDRQLERLKRRNNLSTEDALMRIRAQSRQEEKVARADVVISNDGAIGDTREQVLAAWFRSGAER